MRKYDMLSGLFLLAVSLAIFVGSMHLQSGTLTAPGSVFFPLITGLVMGIFSILIIARAMDASNQPAFFWGVIASMYVGNVMLVILNLPLIGLWVRFLTIPYSILAHLILSFCIPGSYTVKNAVADLIIMLVFGILGFLMRKFRYEVAPPDHGVCDQRAGGGAFIRSLLMSNGSFSIFFTRPSPACS
jgi:TctA family transporter